jgi:hypothetical protein
MKNLAASMVKMSIAVVAILSLIVAVNAGQVALQPKKRTTHRPISTQTSPSKCSKAMDANASRSVEVL